MGQKVSRQHITIGAASVILTTAACVAYYKSQETRQKTHPTSAVASPPQKATGQPEEEEGEGEGDEGEVEIDVNEAAACLADQKAPVAKRTECIYVLRHAGGEFAVEALAKVLDDPSVLIAHEVGFVLGQLQLPSALPHLERALRNTSLDPIVRHEAAEAIAAIGLESSIPLMEEFVKDECPEVRDTCLIGLDCLKWRHHGGDSDSKLRSPYDTVDPSPAAEGKSVEELKAILLDSTASLFHRYEAMFGLRNIGNEEAIHALAAGFADSDSAVFRHEIAYVMGQMRHPASVAALSKVLENTTEHAMVRHEAAEALGSISDPQLDGLLKTFEHDKDTIVAQSCEVALDISDYWQNDEAM